MFSLLPPLSTDESGGDSSDEGDSSSDDKSNDDTDSKKWYLSDNKPAELSMCALPPVSEPIRTRTKCGHTLPLSATIPETCALPPKTCALPPTMNVAAHMPSHRRRHDVVVNKDATSSTVHRHKRRKGRGRRRRNCDNESETNNNKARRKSTSKKQGVGSGNTRNWGYGKMPDKYYVPGPDGELIPHYSAWYKVRWQELAAKLTSEIKELKEKLNLACGTLVDKQTIISQYDQSMQLLTKKYDVELKKLQDDLCRTNLTLEEKCRLLTYQKQISDNLQLTLNSNTIEYQTERACSSQAIKGHLMQIIDLKAKLASMSQSMNDDADEVDVDTNMTFAPINENQLTPVTTSITACITATTIAPCMTLSTKTKTNSSDWVSLSGPMASSSVFNDKQQHEEDEGGFGVFDELSQLFTNPPLTPTINSNIEEESLDDVTMMSPYFSVDSARARVAQFFKDVQCTDCHASQEALIAERKTISERVSIEHDAGEARMKEAVLAVTVDFRQQLDHATTVIERMKEAQKTDTNTQKENIFVTTNNIMELTEKLTCIVDSAAEILEDWPSQFRDEDLGERTWIQTSSVVLSSNDGFENNVMPLFMALKALAFQSSRAESAIITLRKAFAFLLAQSQQKPHQLEHPQCDNTKCDNTLAMTQHPHDEQFAKVLVSITEATSKLHETEEAVRITRQDLIFQQQEAEKELTYSRQTLANIKQNVEDMQHTLVITTQDVAKAQSSFVDINETEQRKLEILRAEMQSVNEQIDNAYSSATRVTDDANQRSIAVAKREQSCVESERKVMEMMKTVTELQQQLEKEKDKEYDGNLIADDQMNPCTMLLQIPVCCASLFTLVPMTASIPPSIKDVLYSLERPFDIVTLEKNISSFEQLCCLVKPVYAVNNTQGGDVDSTTTLIPASLQCLTFKTMAFSQGDIARKLLCSSIPQEGNQDVVLALAETYLKNAL